MNGPIYEPGPGCFDSPLASLMVITVFLEKRVILEGLAEVSLSTGNYFKILLVHTLPLFFLGGEGGGVERLQRPAS